MNFRCVLMRALPWYCTALRSGGLCNTKYLAVLPYQFVAHYYAVLGMFHRECQLPICQLLTSPLPICPLLHRIHVTRLEAVQGLLSLYSFQVASSLYDEEC
jgi:hypothetical protein